MENPPWQRLPLGPGKAQLEKVGPGQLKGFWEIGIQCPTRLPS